MSDSQAPQGGHDDSDATSPERKEQPGPADPIPDGGLTAWLQVVGSFFLFFNSWGIVNTFGVFQTYYASKLLRDQTPSNISWIGSIQAFLLLTIGVATGPVYDAGYFSTLVLIGTFLAVFGMMMTSISGVIYPIIFHQLEPQIGFGWATRVLGFIMMATLGISLGVMKVRIKPEQQRELLQLSAFREIPYTLFTLGQFLGFMGLYIPFFYIQSYAIEAPNTHLDESIAFYLLVILNAASIFGRVIPNFLADKTGPFNMLIPSAAVSSLLAFCWIAIDSKAGLIIFCILYGFFSGAFVSLPPTTVVSLSPSLGVVGTRMGMSSAFAGLGLLIGTPVAGAILGSGTDFVGVQAFCGAIVAAATVAILVARFANPPLEASTLTAVGKSTIPRPKKERKDYIAIAAAKRATLVSLIPYEWRVPDPLPKVDDVPNVTKYALKSLTARESDITENYTAENLVGQIAQGVYSAVEVVRAFGRRAVVASQLTNCLSEVLLSQAIDRATELDNHFAATGTTVGLLHGLPISLKDQFRVAGTETSIGFGGLLGKMETKKLESEAIRILKGAGAVIFVKTAKCPAGRW